MLLDVDTPVFEWSLNVVQSQDGTATIYELNSTDDTLKLRLVRKRGNYTFMIVGHDGRDERIWSPFQFLVRPTADDMMYHRGLDPVSRKVTREALQALLDASAEPE